MKTDFQFTIKLRVRYSETDKMGYCYYGNYAQYFEVGRVETLRSIGMSYKEMEDEGIMLPVSEYKVHYKAPAYYDDELQITTKISEVKGARIFFDYEVRNEQNEVISTAMTVLVFVNKATMTPIPAPDHFMEKIAKYELK